MTPDGQYFSAVLSVSIAVVLTVVAILAGIGLWRIIKAIWLKFWGEN